MLILYLAAIVQAYDTMSQFKEELQFYELMQTMKGDSNFFSPIANTITPISKVEFAPGDKLVIHVVWRDLARLLISMNILALLDF